MILTRDDFIQLTARLQMDLRASQAKLTELRSWLATLDLPERPDDPARRRQLAETFVRNGGYGLTEPSLADELDLRRIEPGERTALLQLARTLRGEEAAA